jgi:hypothetical protein
LNFPTALLFAVYARPSRRRVSKGPSMKYLFAAMVSVGLLALTACAQMQAMPRPAGPPPGGANDPVPAEYLRGSEFDRPDMVRFSWGMELAPQGSEDPNTDYPWSEVRRRLAAHR